MNKNSKKLAAIGTVAVAAIAVVSMGAFAFFTDEAEKQTSGTAGNVSIGLTDITLTNSGNINPGDEDETIDKDARKGTDHNLTFTVNNTGNKSIMTRNVITLQVDSGKLPANVYSLKTDDSTELADKYYSTDGKNFVAAASVTDMSTVKAVRYVTTQVALNGIGENAESADATATTVAGATTNAGVDAVDFDYILKLAKEAGEEYELSPLSVTVEVQAMQYRNTSNAQWETLYSNTLEF